MAPDISERDGDIFRGPGDVFGATVTPTRGCPRTRRATQWGARGVVAGRLLELEAGS